MNLEGLYLTEKLVKNPGLLKLIVYLGISGGRYWESDFERMIGDYADKLFRSLRKGHVLLRGIEYNKDKSRLDYCIYLTPEAREMLPYIEEILSTQKRSAELTV